MALFSFDPSAQDGLHVYVSSVGDADSPASAWPRLLEGRYPSDPAQNPFVRFVCNQSDSEGFAVWRALTWRLLEGRRRFAIPIWDRDRAAWSLGVARHDLRLVAWEYRVDVVEDEFVAADKGFVRPNTSIPLQPPPDAWELENRNRAGLFELDAFDELTRLDYTLAPNQSSEIVLFGVNAEEHADDDLVEFLITTTRPQLEEFLRPGDLFVELRPRSVRRRLIADGGFAPQAPRAIGAGMRRRARWSRTPTCCRRR